MNFFLNLDGIDYPTSEITFAFGDQQCVANDLSGVLNINFEESQIELDPCSCIDGSNGAIVQSFCIFGADYQYCADPTSDNYCNLGDLTPLNGIEDCIYGAIEGCTCPIADNYNSEANLDNGSCFVAEGCNNPLASNYSLSGCDDVSVITDNCLIPGCTCPEAINYDASATENNGSCVSVVDICTDPTASNFNEGCENTTILGAGSENCESGACSLENIIWDYSVTCLLYTSPSPRD